jgi:hypothetical protein
MSPESPCVIDASVPCHACSAAGPDECPYLYVLGWSDKPGVPSPTRHTVAPDRGAGPAPQP